MIKFKIFGRTKIESSNEQILIKQYHNAIKMLQTAWNVFDNTGTESSIYHLKACETNLNEIIKECIKNNVSYNKINVNTMED